MCVLFQRSGYAIAMEQWLIWDLKIHVQKQSKNTIKEITLVNVYVDLLVFTRIAGTS